MSGGHVDDYRYDATILSGGGVKGIGELGALHYHYEAGRFVLSNVKEYTGTSVGSAISLLLICGYTPMEILREVYLMPSFFKPGDLSNIWTIFESYGLMSVNSVVNIVETLVKRKLGAIPTLGEIKSLFGVRLVITAVNITKMRTEYFCPETRPDLSAIDAVKMSCNLPVIFQRIRYNGCYYVDGGLGDNFPVDGLSAKMKGKKVLGVMITGVDGAGAADEELSFFGYFYRLITFPISTMTTLRARDLPANIDLVKLNFDDVPILGPSLPSEKKMEMFMKGYREAKQNYECRLVYVDRWSWNDLGERWRVVEGEIDTDTSEAWGVEWNDGWD